MTPFEFSKDILYQKQHIMNDENKGDYVPWVVNRVLSNYSDTLFYANEMNLFPHLDADMQYECLFHSVRKNYRPFIAYPKAKNSEHIGLIMEAFGYNAARAREALSILNDEQIAEIKSIYEKGDG